MSIENIDKFPQSSGGEGGGEGGDEGLVKNIHKAEEMAYAEKPFQDVIAEEKYLTDEQKKFLINLAEKKGEEAGKKYEQENKQLENEIYENIEEDEKKKFDLLVEDIIRNSHNLYISFIPYGSDIEDPQKFEEFKKNLCGKIYQKIDKETKSIIESGKKQNKPVAEIVKELEWNKEYLLSAFDSLIKEAKSGQLIFKPAERDFIDKGIMNTQYFLKDKKEKGQISEEGQVSEEDAEAIERGKKSIKNEVSNAITLILSFDIENIAKNKGLERTTASFIKHYCDKLYQFKYILEKYKLKDTNVDSREIIEENLFLINQKRKHLVNLLESQNNNEYKEYISKGIKDLDSLMGRYNYFYLENRGEYVSLEGK